MRPAADIDADALAGIARLAALLRSGRTGPAPELLRRHLDTARDILTRPFDPGADRPRP